MDELDRKLEELALNAKKSPPKSQARQLALTQLANEIQKSGRLFCQGRYNYPEDVYIEALQETWLYISRKIEKYDPAIGKVISWVNSRLNQRFIDAIRRYTKNKQASLDQPIDVEGESTTTLLDTIPQPPTQASELEILQEYLEQDPEGLFKQRHIRSHPEASFQAITLRRLAQQSWKEISADWGIPIPTLSEFYQRSVRHFTPKFQEYFRN